MPKSTRGRFSAQRKCEAVLNLLRGDPLDLLSCEVSVKSATLSGWREAFPEGRLGSLRYRVRDERILELERKLGQVAMDHELLEQKVELWGTDATLTLTQQGTATIFIAVDHCTAECVGIHATRRGTRFEALEPIRQAVRQSFGHYDKDVAASLSLRHDHGSQTMSHDFQAELEFLGIRSTFAFVAEPECNGVAERFIRTLEEQLLWVETLASVETLNKALHRFRQLYNDAWLIQKHGHRTPS